MAVIEFLDSKKIQFLSEHHTFGRRRQSVDSHMPYEFVSKLHILVEWMADHWTIKDMSMNGTWVNGERLANGIRKTLMVGDLVELAAEKKTAFKVVDLDAPQEKIYKVEDPNHFILLQEPSCLVPSKLSPEIALFRCPEREKWYAELISRPYGGAQGLADAEVHDDHHPYELGPYQHGDTLYLDGEPWAFFLVTQEEVTTNIDVEPDSIYDVGFRVDLSQDEESAELTLNHVNRIESLGVRSHHYLIAHLFRHKAAQQKRQSADPTVSPESCGWISCELVARELGIDEAHLNILIFRARNQIVGALRGYTGCSRQFIKRAYLNVNLGGSWC